MEYQTGGKYGELNDTAELQTRHGSSSRNFSPALKENALIQALIPVLLPPIPNPGSSGWDPHHSRLSEQLLSGEKMKFLPRKMNFAPWKSATGPALQLPISSSCCRDGKHSGKTGNGSDRAQHSRSAPGRAGAAGNRRDFPALPIPVIPGFG